MVSPVRLFIFGIAAALLAAGLGACHKPAEPVVEAVDVPVEIAAEAFAEKEPEPVPEPVFVLDKSVQISVLLYHEFIQQGAATDMAIPTPLFREQMQRIKDSGHPVVSMADYLAWKRGEKNLPNPCFMLTMDDGWRSVYTDAYPILKEFGFPFTIFLYTNYIASGSKSMTVEQIKELLANGATLGCHSRSHPYPAAVRAACAKGGAETEAFFRREIVESADKLESLFGVRPLVYAYPGGFHLPEMAPSITEAKYQACFTVNPSKVTWETPMEEVHRYVVLGKAPSTFAAATAFRGIPLGRRLIGPDGKDLQLTVSPAEGERITTRLPVLTADLTPVPDLDTASVMLRVSGLGKVDAEFDPVSKILRYQVPVRLRGDECSAFLYWKRLNEPEYDAPMVWKFSLDRRAILLGEIPPVPKGVKLPPPLTTRHAHAKAGPSA